MTVEGAAEQLAVSRVTITRMVGAGLLTAHWPCGAPGERKPTLLSTVEVAELAEARRRAGVAGRAR